jgi:hypothetical protein
MQKHKGRNEFNDNLGCFLLGRAKVTMHIMDIDVFMHILHNTVTYEGIF